ALVVAERRAAASARAQESLEREPLQRIALFYAAFLVMALGFQVHFALNSAPQYLRFAGPGELPWLMPVFWIGFQVGMLPASRFTKRLGTLPVMALAAASGALATLACAFAFTKAFLLAM